MMKRIGFAGLIALAGFMVVGCLIKSGRMVAKPDATYEPASGEAVIVFMRASMVGGETQSSVFDLVGDDNILVGIVSAQVKVAYRTTPGEHIFMVISEAGDFMKADLEAGKTYYALIWVRAGVWRSRFSLKPIHADQLDSEEFGKWESSTTFYENTPASIQWAQKNAPSIQSKRVSYLKDWYEKPANDRPHLLKTDGR